MLAPFLATMPPFTSLSLFLILLLLPTMSPLTVTSSAQISYGNRFFNAYSKPFCQILKLCYLGFFKMIVWKFLVNVGASSISYILVNDC